MEQSTPPPEIKKPFYRLAANSRAPKSNFDIAPLLQVLTQEDTELATFDWRLLIGRFK
ncbi:hypothetical protein [Pontibacter diazotrophicus]|uniref:hypothetical protein n=1 Tax=Pontibacter diazotrophicus TaxID=1400979 RepID=UPI0015F1B865|nr:hypothetical protein [Pontibacter diazotrophicus]